MRHTMRRRQLRIVTTAEPMGGARWSLFCGRENGWRSYSCPTHGCSLQGRQPDEHRDHCCSRRRECRCRKPGHMSFVPPNIPQTLKDRRQWLVWRLVQKPDEPKPRKVPFYASGAPRNGEQGTTADVAALATFDEAVAAVQARGYTGLGFAP